MDCTATAPRPAAEPIHTTLVEAIAGTGHRSRVGRPERMPVLVRYWMELAVNGLASRRDWLAATRESVRSGASTARAFAVHALGDADEDIVFDAVAEYIGAHPVSIEQRQAAMDEAIDWVRRGLVLNRGAAFAALLASGDERIEDVLSGLRLSLTHGETEIVCRRAVARPTHRSRAFVAEWFDLLASAVETDGPALDVVARALASME